MLFCILLLLIYWFCCKSSFFKDYLWGMLLFTIYNNGLITILFRFFLQKYLAAYDWGLSLFLKLITIFEIFKLFKILWNFVNLSIGWYFIYMFMIIILLFVISEMIWCFIGLFMSYSIIVRIVILFFFKIILSSLCFKLGINNFYWYYIALLLLLILNILQRIVHFVFISVLIQGLLIFLRFITIILSRFDLSLICSK